MNLLLKLDHCTIKKYDRILFSDFSWEIKKGENWAILGNSGAGKTSVLQLLRGDFRITKGNFFYQNITDSELALRRFNEAASFVFFQDTGIKYQQFYYQQRYNSSDVEGTFTVSDFLFEGDDSLISGLEALNTLFDLRSFLNTEFIKLSNGESRKVFIIKSLLKKPSVLCLDNPYVGLDESSRKDLNDFVD
ncbi:MAG: ATP-binding cassette domain-containing protein, partial [Bacteroidales bacterium]|nr:ATP-binding cassette domain-containing protein [Bacteroidales bacterium]